MSTAPPKDPNDFELVDFEQVKNWLRFVLHAVRRRKFLAVSIAVLTMGATVGILSVMPRTYRQQHEQRQHHHQHVHARRHQEYGLP